MGDEHDPIRCPAPPTPTPPPPHTQKGYVILKDKITCPRVTTSFPRKNREWYSFYGILIKNVYSVSGKRHCCPALKTTT